MAMSVLPQAHLNLFHLDISKQALLVTKIKYIFDICKTFMSQLEFEIKFFFFVGLRNMDNQTYCVSEIEAKMY